LRAAVDSLLPVLAAGQPSKAPFYVAGAVLATWAVLLGFAGIRRPEFPGSAPAQRAVMAVSALLVLTTIGTAVGTASKHHGEAHAEGEGQGHATPESGGGGATVEISADPSGQLKFEQSSVTAVPGTVKIEFDNPSEVPHDVTVARGAKKLGGTKTIAGAKATAEVVLQPGSYTFYCSVAGHREAGMEGTLSVQAP
jgi:plastocyanin